LAKKAIIFCPAVITFVKRDAEMLSQIYDEVDIRVLDTTKPLKLIWGLINLFFFVLFNIRKYSLVCSWFVGYHSLFPFYFAQIFKIKTVAFLGGTECHNLPFYDHGNYRKTVYSWFTSSSLQHADIMLPVHESLISTQLDYVKVKYPHQGLLAFNKKLAGKVEALHCGFKQEREVDLEGKVENTFLSVASNLSGKVFYRKGIDLFVKLAEANPQFQFTLVGNNYKGPKLSNLKIISAIPYSELIEIYCKHQFYVQFSIAEGFPNALAEAMLYGCIPLGSNVFGIPDIIGDTGFVLKRKDIDLAQDVVDKAVSLTTNEKRKLAEAASQKVKINYTPELRFKKFKEIVEE
jgi:glycosyltransferase involved in cell wall biosynthesis